MQEMTPLTPQQANLLTQLVDGLSTEQLYWVKGYLAGVSRMARQTAGQPAAQESAASPAAHLTILYGSQTGHAQEVAEQAKQKAQAAGFKVDLFAMGDYKPARLKTDKLLLVAVSTQGEGDAPDDAKDFYEFLHGPKAPKLAGTRFSVVGLGDSSYEKFCQAGKDFDARLAALGAERLLPRVDCDVDYDAPAERWIEEALAHLRSAAPAGNAQGDGVLNLGFAVNAVPQAAAATIYSRKNPFPATVLENVTLSGRGSSKEVHHVELSLEGSGLTYEPGDALGIVPQNDPILVDSLIDTLGLDPNATTTTQDGTIALREAFSRTYDITTLSRAFLEKYAALTDAAELKALLQPGQETALREFIYGRDVIDVVKRFPAPKLKPTEFVGTLRTLQPRLYSIASSLHANPDAVHITVGAVRYESHGRQRKGVASTYLADLAREGETLPVYIEANRNFKLPADPNTSIIMVGPGTGIAPFRSFIEQRQAADAQGKNWLFFGDRNFRNDFLYQREWQRYHKDGVLDRIDLAFSRDTSEKVYVQHRLLERSKDVYAWLEEGAHLYVCGDADQMARDVNDTLIAIVQREGGVTADAAAEYVKNLQREKRYQRDVY